MFNTLVTYWTKFEKDGYRMYAVVPTIWLSDFLPWLKDQKDVKVIGTQPTDDGLIIPKNWPSYNECMTYVRYVRAIGFRVTS